MNTKAASFIISMALATGWAACHNTDNTSGQKVATGDYLEVREIRSIDFLIRVPREFERDSSIWSDAYEIVETTDEMFSGLAPGELDSGGVTPRVDITFVGRSGINWGERETAGSEEVYDDDVSIPEKAPAIDEFAAFKLNTRNEFRVKIPRVLRDHTEREAIASGAIHGNRMDATTGPEVDRPPRPTDPNDPNDPTDPTGAALASATGDVVSKGWSNNHDNRALKGSLDSRITTYPWRMITDFSGGCSGALVGPRHVVTAAHCINPAGTNNWNSFTVFTERNGSDWLDSSQMPGCPAGQCNPATGPFWYYTPAQWRQSSVQNREQYDFGFIVIPDRLGDQVGWFGRWYASINTLNTVSKYNRGYPSCDAGPAQNPRIDDPADPLACASCTSNLTVCNPSHMYGDNSSCHLAHPTNIHDGWNRNVRMTCDASAGHSGSPLYFYGDGSVGEHVGTAYYTGHDIQTVCGAYADSNDCAGQGHADRILRLTPEYSGIISYFRQQFP